MKTWQAALAALSLSFAMPLRIAQDVVRELVVKDGKFEPPTSRCPRASASRSK
jgi:hypothetical protein